MASQRLRTAKRKFFNIFFCRGLAETWDCKRAAELLHMAVPVSVRAEPRHWACALLCIASHGWQKDHNMDGWERYAVLHTHNTHENYSFYLTIYLYW